MAALAAEKSRRVTRGAGASAEIDYAVMGAENHADALAAIVAASPATIDPYGNGLVYLPRVSVTADEVGCTALWAGYANYAVQAQPGDAADYEFEIGGRAQHVNCAYAHLADYKRTSDTAAARNHRGLIGVTPDSVEGIDIEVPEYQWSEPVVLTAATVATYKPAWYALYNHVNSLPFKGYGAGEVRFRGCSGGRRRSTGDHALVFRYVATPNRTNIVIPTCGPANAGKLSTRTSATAGTLTLKAGHGITDGQVIDLVWSGGCASGATVGNVTGTLVPFSGASGDALPEQDAEISAALYSDPIVIAAKNGQDLLWIEYEETVQVNAKAAIKVPVAAHIEQVFEYGDLNALGV